LDNWLKLGVLVAICLIPLFTVPAFADPFTLFHTTLVDSFSIAGEEMNPLDLAFSTDGTKMFVAGNDGDDINEYTLSTAFDVSTALFVGSFSIAGEDPIPIGLAFSTDGTKMFVLGSIGKDVNEYTLSTPFDLTDTVTFVDSFLVVDQDTAPRDLVFSSDGTKMFHIGAVAKDVFEYTLSTPFDVSTAMFVDSISTNLNSPIGLAFSSDGTKMFVSNITGGTIKEFTLSTPFDVSTASVVESFSVFVQANDPEGIAFSSDGTKMFVLSQSNNNVNEFTLTTPFTLFHTTFVDSFSVAVQDTAPQGFAFSTDGTKMFVLGDDGDDVNQYTLSTPFDVFTALFVDSVSVAEDTFPQGLAFSTDGTKMFVVGQVGLAVNQYTLSTPFDVTPAIFVDSFSIAGEDSFPEGLAFSTDGTKMFVVGATGFDVNEYTLSTPFDVTDTVTFVDSFDVSGQTGAPRGVTFSSDGTKMFVGGFGADVHKYTLSTPFDVSTALFEVSFSIAEQDIRPQDLAFNSDGTKMFVLGFDGADINEYTLTTPFTFFHTTFVVDPFPVGAQDTLPVSLAFSSDGTKMFVLGDAGDDVNQYTLSTPFDVSTALFVDSFLIGGQETDAQGLAFSTDGTKMFVVGISGDDVNQYTLSTPFDVTPALFVDSVSVAEDNQPRGLAFSTDGTKMFVVGNGGDAVYEYTLSTPFDVTPALFVDSFSIAGEDTVPTDLAFSSDGTKMFVVGAIGSDINEYILSTPFDVSTALFVDSFSVAAQNPEGLAFSTDGTKMFVLMQNLQDVNEYNITSIDTCSPPPSGNWIVDTSCTMTSGATINNGDLIVQMNSVLTVPFTLDIDFSMHKITVESGSGVLIKSGGAIT